MKLRALAFTIAVCGACLTAINCGSEGGSAFGVGENGEDGGGSLGPGFATSDGGDNSSSGCTKLTCADLGINCGPAGDGCGGLIESCGTCQGQETCGGGGVPSVCGGTAGCVPRTCEELGVECGPAGDGCGGLLDCHQCPAPQICGGGGPSKCGGGQVADGGVVLLPDGGTCVGRTTCNPGECGPVANGCGGILNCPSTCPAGQTCGGAGQPSQCGTPPCTKTTCAAQNANCGFVADGCGSILDCGGPSACTNPGEFCGGGGPNRCGTGTDGGTGPACTGLCLDQPTDCPGGTNTTTITGTVYMPNGRLPVYDAVVYVPNGPLEPVPEGIGTCDTCSAQVSGSPLVQTRTDAYGKFTLTNMPHRTAAQGGVPVVIQKGRWRKQIRVNTNRCGTVALSNDTVPQVPTANNTTFGSTETATNHIPKFAVTTGGADALQCLLRKLGIADSEFRHYGDGGRVNVFEGGGGSSRYRGNNGKGYSGTSTWSLGSTTRRFPNQTYLFGNSSTGTVDTSKLDQYDAVVLTCEGGSSADNNGDWVSNFGGYAAEMKAYADRGGRIFASHWHHAWLEYGPSPWGGRNTPPPLPLQPIATIGHHGDPPDPSTATINTSFDKGNALATWLVNANTINGTPAQPFGQLSISEPQRTITAVDTTRATPWISIASNNIQYFDFNTPVGAETQCGRFVISDVHVSAGDSSGNGNCPGDESDGFPCNCTSTGMTDQEKVLMFMLFDLTSCIEPVQPPPPPTCSRLSCQDQGIECGPAGDGCGGELSCGPCAAGKVCRGNPGKCVTPTCNPRTCESENAECGLIADGCGQTVNCGPCTAPGQVCGGSGPNQCGANSCTPTTCEAQNIHCGPAGNGCGGLLDCGPCPPGQTCGGGGTPGVCGAPACTPRTCQQANANCGYIADGCGNAINCGTCPPGQTCGGGGKPNQCGGGNLPK